MRASFPPRILNRLLSNRSGQAWTCAQCRSTEAAAAARGARQFTTTRVAQRFLSSGRHGGSSGASNPGANARGGGGPGRGKGRVVLWASTGTVGVMAGLMAVSDGISTSYEATERAARVGTALVICINDYRTTLNQREKIDDDEERYRLLKECHKRCAERTLDVLQRNGGIFIKLGQHLSAMNYLLPVEWTSTFIPLQDQCPVSSLESIEKMFKRDTGEDLSDYFSEFSPEPIGAASLAQVHIATIKETGQRVAVKVQHPGLAQWAPLDLSLTKYTFQALKRFFPEYDLSWLSSEMEYSLPQELDFTREAENAMRTKEYFSHHPDLPLVIPNVIWSKNRILVMAFESGKRLDDLDYLDSNGIDRDEVSATLARIFNEMIFGHGAPLHCDPHGGNIAIRKNSSRRFSRRDANFDIILYDHGLYRDIPEDLRRSYAKMWLAIIDGDLERMRKYVKEVANVEDDQFPLFASAITGRDFSVVSTSIMTPKSRGEKKTMSTALQEGLLADLVQMLGQVPRIILLILKTNDLTRSLDESLHTRQGPVRSFLILARYCARTVLREQLDEIRSRGSALLLWPPEHAWRFLRAWVSFVRVEFKLQAFELWLSVKRGLGLSTDLGLGVM